MRHDGRSVCRSHAEQVAEAWERAQPAREFHTRRLREPIQPKLRTHARAFEQHRQRAHDAAVADVLSHRAEAAFRQRGKQREIAAKTLRRRIGARVPEGFVPPPCPAQIHGHDEIVARSRIEAGEQPRSLSQHCRRKIRRAACDPRGVPAHDRHGIRLRRGRHSRPDLRRCLTAWSPEHIHHRQRTPAHRRHVAQIHHHRRIPRKPRIGLHKGFQHPLRRKKQPPIAIRNRRAIVTHLHLPRQCLSGRVGRMNRRLVRHRGAGRKIFQQPGERRPVLCRTAQNTDSAGR